MRANKPAIIISLGITAVFMAVVYAMFSTTLNITGSSQGSGSFDVKITNVELDSEHTRGATNTTPEVGNDYAVTETTLSATFNAPGDYITYDITVTNRGSIDAVISLETAMEDSSGAFNISCNATEGAEISANGGIITFKCAMTFDENVDDLTNITTAHMTVSVKATQKATYTPPAQACYTPRNESKTMGLISGSTKIPVSTVGVNNIQVGDLLGYGTSDIDSNEQFYVIEKNGSTLKLLSRYGINVGPHQKPWDNCSRDTRGLQDNQVSLTRANVDDSSTPTVEYGLLMQEMGYLYGSVAFSNTNYWHDNNQYISPYTNDSFVYPNSNIKTYVDQYVSTLNTLGLNATNGTVLSIQEMATICNISDFRLNTSVSGCPNYVFETSYWLGSNDGKDNIWVSSAVGLISSYNDPNYYQINFANPNIFGIRPVITITLN